MGQWSTFRVELAGGILENVSPLQQGISHPGSLTTGVNMEPALDGGYSRILGFERFNTTQCPSGAVNILGVWEYEDDILAFADDQLWSVVEGSAVWTSEYSSAGLSGVSIAKAARNTWGTVPEYTVVTGQEAFFWNSGADGPLHSTVTGATSVAAFHNRMWFGVGPEVHVTNFNKVGELVGDFTTSFRMQDDVLDMAVWRDALYVFGREYITKITGYEDADLQQEQVSTRLGVIRENTVQEVAGDLMFLSADGIRTIAGTDRIGDTALDNLSVNISQRVEGLRTVSADVNLRSVVLQEKGQYRLYSSADSVDDEFTPGILGGLRAGPNQQGLQWEFFDLRGMKPYSINSAYFDKDEKLFFGTYDGYINHQEPDSYSFNATDITWSLEMPFWVLTVDDPEIRKVLYKLNIYADSPTGSAGNMTYRLNYLGDYKISAAPQPIQASGIVNSYNSGVKYNQTGFFYTSSLESVSKHNIQGSCQNVSFKFAGADQLAPHTFKTALLQFSVEGKL